MGSTHDLVAQPRLLLFAGLHGSPRGGAGDLVGWFESEDDARAAFRELRVTRSDEDGWAELVALGRGGRPTMVAWFGRRRSHHPAGRSSRRHLRVVGG
jgi:hypothetical protein